MEYLRIRRSRFMIYALFLLLSFLEFDGKCRLPTPNFDILMTFPVHQIDLALSGQDFAQPVFSQPPAYGAESPANSANQPSARNRQGAPCQRRPQRRGQQVIPPAAAAAGPHEKAAEQRKKTQLDNFEGYGAEQVKLLDASIIKTKGTYVLFVISPKAETVEKAFTKSLK